MIALPPETERDLFIDWIVGLARNYKIYLGTRQRSGASVELMGDDGSRVSLRMNNTSGLMEVCGAEGAIRSNLSDIIDQARSYAAKSETGHGVWYSTCLVESKLDMQNHGDFEAFKRNLLGPVRTKGWMRLGPDVIAEICEEAAADGSDGGISLKRFKVNVHAKAPGPSDGDFSRKIAAAIFESAACVCGFVLGRPFELATYFFASDREDMEVLERKNVDNLPYLAMGGVDINIFGRRDEALDNDSPRRLRSALVSFDAAQRQSSDPVACILYIIAAESLTNPMQDWRTKKVTTRFQIFYEKMLKQYLDAMLINQKICNLLSLEFSGGVISLTQRRRLLKKIYHIRSEIAHEGLPLSYIPFSIEAQVNWDKRVLLRTFSQVCIVEYVKSPRCSLVGHPKFSKIEEDSDAS